MESVFGGSRRVEIHAHDSVKKQLKEMLSKRIKQDKIEVRCWRGHERVAARKDRTGREV